MLTKKSHMYLEKSLTYSYFIQSKKKGAPSNIQNKSLLKFVLGLIYYWTGLDKTINNRELYNKTHGQPKDKATKKFKLQAH